MTTALDWYPKPFTPGDMEGGGALKLLGKPNLHLVSVLVRETAQNSWDARLKDQTVEFVLHGRTLHRDGICILRDRIFSDAGKGTGVGKILSSDQLDVLEVTDRGTCGLGGPIRNDIAYQDDVETDYVDFVLNIGAKQDKSMGGGTYGYGKTICYLASSVQTIVIWTKTEINGVIESRLIASAFGEQFDLEGKRYTGRQWWGRLKADMIEPVTGQEADEIAASLYSKPFADGETGTSILILSPILSDNIKQLIKQCSTAALWHLWPKIISFPGTRPAMTIATVLEGQQQSIPDPSQHPFLRGYVQSLNAIRAMQKGDNQSSEITSCVPITFGRTRTVLGHLAVSKVPCIDDRESDDPIVPVSGVSSHVALMRHETELVVMYQPNNKPPIDSVHYCGVFKPIADMDASFAKSEPPAHDSWEWAGMRNKTQKSHVRVALRKIKETWAIQTQRKVDVKHSQLEVALGGLSSQLSDLVPEIGGTRAGPGRVSPRKKKKAKRKAVVGRTTSGGERKPESAKRNRITVINSGLSPSKPGDSIAFVQFNIEGEIRGIELTVDIGIGYDGGTDTTVTDEYVHNIYFIDGHWSANIKEALSQSEPDGMSKKLPAGAEPNWTLAVLFDDTVALDIDLRHKQVTSL